MRTIAHHYQNRDLAWNYCVSVKKKKKKSETVMTACILERKKDKKHTVG